MIIKQGRSTNMIVNRFFRMKREKWDMRVVIGIQRPKTMAMTMRRRRGRKQQKI